MDDPILKQGDVLIATVQSDMRERVNVVGGNLMLLSAPGDGMEVVITIPLEA